MTPLREAAQRALEALEYNRLDVGKFNRINAACRALRAALAEPVQEPKPVEFDHGIGADRFRVVRGAFWWHVLIGDSPTEHGKFRSRASAEKMAADLLREFRNGAFVQHEAALATVPSDCPNSHQPVQEPLRLQCAICNTVYDEGVPPQAQDWSLLKATQESLREHMQEIHRLRAALAEPEQEPEPTLVAWRITDGEGDWEYRTDLPEDWSIQWSARYGRRYEPLYSAPIQRKPLTVFEIDAIAEHLDKTTIGWSTHEFAAAIEKAHEIGGEA